MMINMKMTKDEAMEEASDMMSMGEDAMAYPCGLKINLDDEVLSKLSLDDPPDVGTEVILMCKALVISVSSDAMQDGDTETRCTLQITDMDFNEATSSLSDAEVLYGKK